MATDATGTPTAKGIRKYNPDADAPSGVGFNGAIDDIDALFDKAQYSTDTKGTNKVAVWNGAAWVYSLVTTGMITDASVSGGKLAWNKNAAPPGSPADGDIWALPFDANGRVWLFRYNLGSASSFKWEFIGGSDAFSYVATSESTLSTTATDLATVGPTVTIPRAGDYHIEYGAVLQPNASAAVAEMVIFQNAAAIPVSGAVGFTTSGGNSEWSGGTVIEITGAAAADVLKAKYFSGSGAINASFQQRYLKVRPIRVS